MAANTYETKATFKGLIGLTLKNDGASLEALLNEISAVTSLRHTGNFVFEAALAAGGTLTVHTEPVDEEYAEIIITEVKDSRLADFFETLVSPFGIETLETRNSDILDFHDLSVWSLREMLEAAYEHGFAAAKGAA